MDSRAQPILSSLPLQMCLHFHLYLLPFILVSQISCFALKYDYLHPINQVVLIAFHLIFVSVELCRPYLGYYGNLCEKIPALSGFCTLSLILQLPITLFFCFNEGIYPLPLERFVYIIQIVFLVLEICISGVVIRRLANYQIAVFKARLDEEPEVRRAVPVTGS
ncbi:hypothetical protein M3Y94_00427700 [Aphelenchoides besseyi]|nr:hypothetical protein M3Y94_00427700 [Aphelenchoides besseyi]